MPTRPDRDIVSHSFTDLAAVWEKDTLNAVKFTGVPLEDVSIAKNIIIASRPKLYANLINSIALDIKITNFDIDSSHDLIAICSGRVTYLFNLSSFDLIQKFGRVDGGAHKGSIRDVCINSTATHIASCGEDRRIAVWNISTGISEKTFEAHEGVIYQVEFSKDGDQVITCSEDGRAIIWDWITGSPLMSFMKHPTAVRSLDFNFESPEQLYCGRADGYTTVWNLDYLLRMDNIVPDAEWLENAVDESLIGWEHNRRFHSGSINCVKIAPNGWLLATGSNDHTCKLWNIVSHRKQVRDVQSEISREEESIRNLNSYINVTDPKYDFQAEEIAERSALRVGEVDLATGYHSDLMLTLRHDGPVLSLCFSPNSVLIATGSADSTCRLWSSSRGDLLFQINTPSPVESIFLGNGTNLYASCQNRLLVFEYRIKVRENTIERLKPLPNKAYANAPGEVSEKVAIADLQAAVSVGDKIVPVVSSAALEVTERIRKEMRIYDTIMEEEQFAELEIDDLPEASSAISEPKSYELSINSERRFTRKRATINHQSSAATVDDNKYLGVDQMTFGGTVSDERSGSPAVPELRLVSLDDLKKLSSHGLLKPKALDSIVQNTPDVDIAQLNKNMTKYNVHPNQILRLLINSGFSPRDLLFALSRKTNDVAVLYSMLSRNNPITGYMSRLGFQLLSALDKSKEKHAVYIRRQDLEKPSKGSVVVSNTGESFEYASWFKSYWPERVQEDPRMENPAYRYDQDYYMDSEDEDDLLYEDYIEDEANKNRGSLLHFVPSMQIKLLKDLQAKKRIRPIFLRQLLAESESGTRYPNFRPEDEAKDMKVPYFIR